MYNFADLKLVDHIETIKNARGLVALCPNSTNMVLGAFPILDHYKMWGDWDRIESKYNNNIIENIVILLSFIHSFIHSLIHSFIHCIIID